MQANEQTRGHRRISRPTGALTPAVPNPAVMTVNETAAYFRISRASVWRLLKNGDLPKTRIGGRALVRRVDADAFLARCVES